MKNTYGLIIGVANYHHINKLPPTVLKDAQDIYDLLVEPSHCGYAADNVTLLLDAQATRIAITQALAALAQQSDEDSTVFIYISSHGGRIESGQYAGEYLLPVDVNASSKASISQSSISGVEFTEALRAIPARKVLVIFDCCHSGGIGQPKDATAPMIKTGLPESYYDALAQGRGRAILASSRSDEYSWILPGAANSLFTHHLLAGLQGGIASDDGLIRVFNLFEYLQPKVTIEQPEQHPIFKAEVEENFPVALYLGGKKGKIDKDEEGFRYDAYISYVEQEPDETWVWEMLLPRLQTAGLRVAVSDEVWKFGVDRVVNISRGIKQTKYIVLVLSEAYIADEWTRVEHIMAETKGIQENTYRIIPILFTPMNEQQLPDWIGGKWAVDLTNSRRFERRLNTLIQQLRKPLPERREHA